MLLAVCAIFAVLGAAYGDGGVGNVAFLATLDDSSYKFVGGDAIVYNKVILNHGNAYGNTTGVFTAPKSGIYVFNFHALTSWNSKFQLKLYRNEEYIVSAFADKGLGYDAAGNTAVLKLTKGDRVYLKPDDDTYLFGKPKEIYATFSGYLASLAK